MSGVNRDLDAIIKFCQDFETGYLQPMRGVATKLKGAAGSASATLRGTQFATAMSEKLEQSAADILKACQTGEERILELKRRAQQQKDEKERIEGGLSR